MNDPNFAVVITLAVIIGGWVMSVERRIWGLKDLSQTVRRIDRRTFQMLMKTDPQGAMSELASVDALNDKEGK